MVRVIMRSRGKGKTTSAIHMSVKEGYHIIARNERGKTLLQQTAKDLGYNLSELPEIYVYSELNRGGLDTRDGLIIENAEHWLKELIGSDLKAITLTPESLE